MTIKTALNYSPNFNSKKRGAKQIKLALKVDPQLIGGFTIEIGSKMIDTSIRGQLKQISTLLGA